MAYLIRRFVCLLLWFCSTGNATRFLPMIVWDHLNPLLYCKCNWLTIPSIDEYDRVDFMCPSLKVAVKLLDGYSRPTSEMNENIYKRKWKGSNLNDLKNSLQNDSFCDTSHIDTEKLHSCKDGEEGKSLGVNFRESTGYKRGDIFVFFNNGHDGKAATLTSTNKKCSMVFVVNITWIVRVNHDISYGKCLNPNDQTCQNLDRTCEYQCKHGIATTFPPVTAGVGPSSSTNENKIQPTGNSSTESSQSPGSGRCDRGWLTNAAFFGILIASIVLSSICTFVCVTLRNKSRRKSGSRGYVPGSNNNRRTSSQSFYVIADGFQYETQTKEQSPPENTLINEHTKS